MHRSATYYSTSLQRFSEIPDSEYVIDILAIPKLRFCFKKAQSNGFQGITDKIAIPYCSVTSLQILLYYI